MGGGPKELLLVTVPLPEDTVLMERVRKKYPNMEVRWRQHEIEKTKTDLPLDLFARTTILVTLFQLPPSVSSCPHLQLIHFISAGIDPALNHPLYTSTTIPLTTSNGVHGPQIAEWVLLTALAQNHNYNTFYEQQKRKEWGRPGQAMHVRDYAGQKVGVLGYGSIGRQVGRAFAALGCEIHAYTASPRPTPSSKRDTGYHVPNTGDPDGSIPVAWYSGLDKPSIHAFLRQELDVLVLCMPLTPASTHLLGREEFDILAKQEHPPLLSNISRGKIVDQDALIATLKNGGLRGACLDVADPEPLPAESELWGLPNVIVTPHVSGHTSKYMERSWAILEMNLERRARGEGLVNLVDRKKGY